MCSTHSIVFENLDGLSRALGVGESVLTSLFVPAHEERVNGCTELCFCATVNNVSLETLPRARLLGAEVGCVLNLRVKPQYLRNGNLVIVPCQGFART